MYLRSTISTTPSIILNKNATPNSHNNNKKKPQENVVKVLPKISERPKTVSKATEQKSHKPRTTSSRPNRGQMTRSQSLSVKRVISDVPSVEITEMDYPPVVGFERLQFNSLLLKAPLPEDDNANFHAKNLEKDAHDVLKGKYMQFSK